MVEASGGTYCAQIAARDILGAITAYNRADPSGNGLGVLAGAPVALDGLRAVWYDSGLDGAGNLVGATIILTHVAERDEA